MKAQRILIALYLCLAAAVTTSAAEPFRRPSVTELAKLVDQGTKCGDAVRERGWAVGQNYNYFPYSGSRLTYYTYFNALQQNLLTLAPMYVNHTNNLPFTTNGFLFFTLATWRTAANLNQNGFRRATNWDGVNDPAYSYGCAQAGDRIGPWICADVRTGYTYLVKTGKLPTLVPAIAGATNHFHPNYHGTNWLDATSKVDSNLTVGSSTTITDGQIWRVSGATYYSSTDYDAGKDSMSGKAILAWTTNLTACAILYGYGNSRPGYAITKYADFGIGLPNKDTWTVLRSTFSVPAVATYDSGYYVGINNVNGASWWCQMPSASVNPTDYGFQAMIRWLIVPSFTYQDP